MAPLSGEDRILIQILRTEKRFNAYQMMTEFPSRKWKKRTLHDLIKKIDATGSSTRRASGDRRRSARTAENIARVGELICSQDDRPGTSNSLGLVFESNRYVNDTRIYSKFPTYKRLGLIRCGAQITI